MKKIMMCFLLAGSSLWLSAQSTDSSSSIIPNNGNTKDSIPTFNSSDSTLNNAIKTDIVPNANGTVDPNRNNSTNSNMNPDSSANSNPGSTINNGTNNSTPDSAINNNPGSIINNSINSNTNPAPDSSVNVNSKNTNSNMNPASGSGVNSNPASINNPASTNNSSSNSNTNANTNNSAASNVMSNSLNVPGQPGYASLPVLETSVPDAVVTKVKEKYGNSVYDITCVKHTTDQLAYIIRTAGSNGVYKTEMISEDGNTIQ